MGEAADNALNYFIRNNLKVRKDRVRHKIIRCPTCGKEPLHFLEENTDEWYLGEFDEDNHLVRHTCKIKGKFKRVIS